MPHHEQEAATANSILNTQGKELASVEDRSVDILRSVSFWSGLPYPGKNGVGANENWERRIR